MEVGEKDELHHHKNHLIYVLEGDGVTIYPGGDESAAMVVPLAVSHSARLGTGVNSLASSLVSCGAKMESPLSRYLSRYGVGIPAPTRLDSARLGSARLGSTRLDSADPP